MSLSLRLAFSSWMPLRFEYIPIFGGRTVILRLCGVWLIVSVALI